MAIHYIEGQFVQKGQLLAEIDPRPFQVQLQQAEGQLARDMAQLNDAKVNLARYEYLWKQQIIAKQQLDTQAASVGQYEGVIEADKAAINNAKLQLTYANVTSPLSGRIGLRQVDVGNIVHASDANGLATIAQMQPIAVLFTIPADNLPPVLQKLRAGAKLPVYAYDRDDVNRIATGVLLTVDNQIDPQTGTSRLKAQFPNGDMSLFPNQFVNCRLLLDVRHGLTLVPAAAIQHGPQGTFVFVVQNGVAHMQPVSVSLTESGDAAVEGVQAGELVVTDGQDKLQEGAKVTIQGAARPGPGAAGRGPRNRPPAAAPHQPPATGTAGQQVTPGPAAPNGPGGQYKASGAPSGGPGQGAPWRGPGVGQPAHRREQGR
jgi:multidrug efflux system membrane fusion protein